MSRNIFNEKYHVYSGVCSGSVLLITNKGVFAAGDNDNGQLGIGNNEHQSSLQEVKVFRTTFRSIVKISVGYHNTIFLFTDGSVFGCGSGKYSLFGEDDSKSERQIQTPEKLVFPEKNVHIVDCESGWGHALFLSKHGIAFGAGYNHDNQTGCVDSDLKNHSLLRTMLSEKEKVIIKMQTQDFTSFFLCASGDLYGCGSNSSNQINSNSGTEIRIPTKILGSYGTIVDLSVGTNHVLIKTKDNKILGLGENIHGQTGLGKEFRYKHVCADDSIIPFCVDKTIIGFKSYGTGSLFETPEGVFSCGTFNTFKNDELWFPVKINLPEGAAQIVCGCQFIFVICRDKTIYGLGKNDRGVLFSQDSVELEDVALKSGVNLNLRDSGTILFRENPKLREYFQKLLSCQDYFDMKISTYH